MNPTTLLIALSVAVFSLAIVVLYPRQQIRDAQKKNLWPPPGQLPTMEDVQRLAQSGQKILAIKLYRKIHNVGLKQAKEAVENLDTR